MVFSLMNKEYASMKLAFEAIPTSETVLNLSRYDLGYIDAFAASPPEDGVNFEEFDEILNAFGAIPEHVISLDLSWNGLDYPYWFNVAQLFAAIPAHVTTLDLTRNHFYERETSEIVAILKAIPASVTSLNLDENYLGDRNSAEVAQILAAIPVSVTSLNLNNNALSGNETLSYHLSDAEIKKIFCALPEKLVSLSLQYNDLHRLPCVIFEQLCKLIPATLTSLDLRNNRFEQLPTSELLRRLRSIPPTVKTIELNYKDLFLNRSLAEKGALLIALDGRLSIPPNFFRESLVSNSEPTSTSKPHPYSLWNTPETSHSQLMTSEETEESNDCSEQQARKRSRKES